MAKVLRWFQCGQCNRSFNENESPSDDFCSQGCQKVWIRVISKKLDPKFDIPPVRVLPRPASGVIIEGYGHQAYPVEFSSGNN